jgi:tetratricopeptide (TPR) repeat protein
LAKTLLAVLLAATAMGQRSKPVFDPETKEGLLIQEIQQERDPVERIRFLEQFAVQYPSHPAIAWVYDQLQPAYFEMKEYDHALRIGGLRVAIEPGNLEAASLALRSAEAKHDSELVSRWANRAWEAASKAAARQPADAEAKQLQAYAVYCLHTTALEASEPRERIALLRALEKMDPTGPFASTLPGEIYSAYIQLGDHDHALEVAEAALRVDPANTDMLLAAAELHFRKEDARDKVVAYCRQLVDLLEKKAKPENLSAEEWEKKKARVLGMANYMGGVSSSLLNQLGRADTMLRASLPSLKDNPNMEATALYLLGLANYRLAESGSRTRAMDALRFTERCAAIKSPYQAQAIKNIASIKSEYNLQ